MAAEVEIAAVWVETDPVTQSQTTFPPFTEMTAEQFQAHLDQRSVNTHDGTAVSQWFTEDAVQRSVATNSEAVGRDAIREQMDNLFRAFPDFRIEVRDLFSTTDRICLQCSATGTHQGDFVGLPPTGQQIAVDWCLVFRVAADGLVEEEILYSDLMTMLGQLGLSPSN